MKIADATREDLDSIVRLNRSLADFHRKIDKYYKRGSETEEGFSRHLMEIFGKEDFRILVAKDDGNVIAYFIGAIEKARPFVVPDKIGRISDAYVSEEYRRRGLGKQMLDELVKWFKENGIKHIELSVDSRNKIAIKAWEKFGFFEFMKKMRLDL